MGSAGWVGWGAAVGPGWRGPAFEYRLSDPRVHLADVDADGRSDLVVTESDLVKYFPNRGKLVAAVNGSAVWGEAREMSIDGEAPPPPFVFPLLPPLPPRSPASSSSSLEPRDERRGLLDFFPRPFFAIAPQARIVFAT